MTYLVKKSEDVRLMTSVVLVQFAQHRNLVYLHKIVQMSWGYGVFFEVFGA